MTTLRQRLGAVFVVVSIALAALVHGCSSSSDQTGGPLGNPGCDGGTCDDSSVPLDSSTNDVQFDVDTTPPDAHRNDTPTDTPADADNDG